MKVEIWSDFVCPFCYIGKKKFEKALASFSAKDEVEVIWKSYQLDPEVREKKHDKALDYMTETKGLTKEAVEEMFQHVEQMANEEGLNYDLKRTIPANTFKAHKLMQLAKSKRKGDLVEEHLFSSHFLEFKDIDDEDVLREIGRAIGLADTDIESAFTEKTYEDKVSADIYEARQVGVRGVPFFVFDKKYAISGAQPADAFLEVLSKVKSES